MKSAIPCSWAIAACVAVWASASPAQAQADPDYTIDSNNPSCQDVVEICSIERPIYEVEISDVTTNAASKCVPDLENPGLLICSQDNFDETLGLNFKVSWTVLESGEVNVFDASEVAVTELFELPGFEAVIGEGKTASNVYCGFDTLEILGISAPQTSKDPTPTPTKLTFCWGTANPCRLSSEEVENTCIALGLATLDNNIFVGTNSYIQGHLVRPEQPINICGCGGEGQVVQFGTPGNSGQTTGVGGQGTATSGNNTCQRVVIGGRALFIGDTC